MAPDRVGALLRVAGSFVAAGVDDLEVVDVAVALVEVAVLVEVVPVLDVERLQVVGRLRDVGEGAGSIWSSTQMLIALRTSCHVFVQTMPPQAFRP